MRPHCCVLMSMSGTKETTRKSPRPVDMVVLALDIVPDSRESRNHVNNHKYMHNKLSSMIMNADLSESMPIWVSGFSRSSKNSRNRSDTAENFLILPSLAFGSKAHLADSAQGAQVVHI